MPDLIGLTELANQALLLTEYQQDSLYDQGVREPAIRGFIIVGCFVVIPVVFAWFMERCSTIHDRRMGVSEDD
jgi:hypothetical protein